MVYFFQAKARTPHPVHVTPLIRRSVDNMQESLCIQGFVTQQLYVLYNWRIFHV